MVHSVRVLVSLALLAIMIVGCSQNSDVVAPKGQTSVDLAGKDGTETLGEPTLEIASGSGFAIGGVGMVGSDGGARSFDVVVPAGATVNQAILYWSGGTTAANGDDTLTLNGSFDITGDLIGGPAFFYDNGFEYFFSAYRYDITSLDLIGAGTTTLTVEGMNFEFPTTDENNGVGVLVIYDDGTSADLQLRDGLDLAHFRFPDPRQATIPQTFTFTAESEDRIAQMPIMAGSVGENRPNEINVTTNGPNGSTETIPNPLGSNNGLLWDAVNLDVTIPADATTLTVELISVDSLDPLGASMSWVAGGLAVPETPDPELYCIGDYVWHDADMDGCQDADEMGVEGVEVKLWTGCPPEDVVATEVTGAEGMYLFCDLMPGDYTVQFVLPDGYVFSAQYSGDCDTENDSNADPTTGITDCIVLAGDDLTIDAGIYPEPEEGCTNTIGFWKGHAGEYSENNGNQEDLVTPLLPIWLGNPGGEESVEVTWAQEAVWILDQHHYGHPSNGITKMRAQLLAAKLNYENGASISDIADVIDAADDFLTDYSWEDWGDLTDDQKDDVQYWHEMLDEYNKGNIGPGHCDDIDEDESDYGKKQDSLRR